ncbi:MAG: hypothetical protein H0T42_03190 [Deltaproteobacteria bacterium]|nr:hypothetical protein [Deltaproteobacteria bacterium]
MRSIGLALVLTSSLVACNGGGTSGGDDTVEPDAPGTIDPPARGFQVTSKDVTIMPGEEITYCYYFRTPNTEMMAINKWKSVMTPGSHHMIMFTTATDVMPPGTVSPSNCGFGASNGSNAPSWTYSAQNALNEIELPSDDGAGKPLAQEIAPNTPAYFQMHYLNATDEPLVVHVTLNAEALAAGTAFTKTAAYTTYNAAIQIPAMSNGTTATKTCTTPAGSKFWLMSTHAHKQAVKTTIKNGGPASTDITFESTDWEHPGAQKWMAAPFYTFAGNQLTFSCTYNNPNSYPITSGDSADSDEMCMASGYYFPATEPVFCYCVAQGCLNL